MPVDATMEGACWTNGPGWEGDTGDDRMSTGRKGSPEVTAQANIIVHSPRSRSSCWWEWEDSPPACCEAPSYRAIAVSAGPWIIDPPVA